MSYDDYNNSDFAKAMRELKAQDPVQEETKDECPHTHSFDSIPSISNGKYVCHAEKI